MSLIAQISGTTYTEAKKTKQANLIFHYDDVVGLTKDKNGLLMDLTSSFLKYIDQKDEIKVNAQYILERDFSKMMNQVKNAKGGVFGLSNITVTDARKKDYDFTPSYMKDILVLITNKNVPTLKSMNSIAKEFKGKVGYGVANSTHIIRLNQIKKDHFPNLQIKEFPSGMAVMNALEKNDNAFAIADLLFYLADAKKDNRFNRHPVGDNAADELAIAMPKDNDWGTVFAEFFKEYKLSEDYRMSIYKNLGKASLRMLSN